jgi:DNA-directed RNA polymerase specialized sigma24 family protein
VPSDGEQLKEISLKLDRVIRLLALNAVPAGHSLQEKATILSRIGFAPKEIAEIIGTTPNAVSVTLSAAKRSKARKAKPSKRSKRSR